MHGGIRNSDFFDEIKAQKVYKYLELMKSQIELANELMTRGHHVILVDYQPTSENMVIDFAAKIGGRLPNGIKLHSLRLQETESSFAEWFAVDNL